MQKKAYCHLIDESSISHSDHESKSNLLWVSFEERLGTSDFTSMLFNLSELLTLHLLDDLEMPFTTTEIDSIIKSLPNDKSPRPDGFNNEFLKKYWPIIRNDFYRLC